ncbi:type II toxin-antitoxin system PemK/MazF family toxin [Maricaulis sp.]|uniref:type II toxin-antitoxin system PemK/MazF family toxin n=1 Tax=Maricaulis sp. TaxID=1486257 RepID=UPI003A8EF2C1
MAIQFAPRTGSVLLCDFSLGGFRPPEMVKRRPVVVLSPRLRRRDGLVSVVPLSTTRPGRPVPYVVPLSLTPLPPAPFDAQACWAKCDMVSCVGFGRLDFFRTPRGGVRRRTYLKLGLSADQLAQVRCGVKHALGLAD